MFSTTFPITLYQHLRPAPASHICNTYIYIPLTLYCEVLAEAFQILLRDAHVLPNYLAMRNTADETGGKPIAV
jgi:hypothetical protein